MNIAILHDKNDWKHFTGEENSGELVVETAGYIPLKKQITNMMNAGIALENARKGIYDFKTNEEVLNDEDSFEEDILNDSDVDIIDLDQLSKLARGRITERHKHVEGSDDIAPEGLKASSKVDIDGSAESKELMDKLD